MSKRINVVVVPSDKYSSDAYAYIFLAGGITNCPDWQTELIEIIKKHAKIDYELDIFNPRRTNFPIGDKKESRRQIEWEHDKFEKSDLVCFWFAKGSINPIVLYELGRWGNSQETDIIVGVDEEYQRKEDVIIQTELSRHEINVHVGFENFADAVLDFLENEL